jgi:hypothetical protein
MAVRPCFEVLATPDAQRVLGRLSDRRGGLVKCSESGDFSGFADRARASGDVTRGGIEFSKSGKRMRHFQDPFAADVMPESTTQSAYNGSWQTFWGGFFQRALKNMLWMKVRAKFIFPFVSTTCRARWVPSLRGFAGLTSGSQSGSVERQSIERTIEELLATFQVTKLVVGGASC